MYCVCNRCCRPAGWSREYQRNSGVQVKNPTSSQIMRLNLLDADGADYADKKLIKIRSTRTIRVQFGENNYPGAINRYCLKNSNLDKLDAARNTEIY